MLANLGEQAILISIHAPARGATARIWNEWFRDEISIHAPARGATEYIGGNRTPINIISIHAPARGATLTYVVSAAQKTVFQFTPLREGRPGPYC